MTVSIDVLHPTPHVLLMGGGHCAVAFANVAEQLGWRTSVQDSREAYADAAHHPAAAERHVNSVDEFSPLKTRPHWHDFQISCCSAMTMRRIGHVCMASSSTSTLQAIPGQSGAPRIGCIGSAQSGRPSVTDASRQAFQRRSWKPWSCPIGLQHRRRDP